MKDVSELIDRFDRKPRRQPTDYVELLLIVGAALAPMWLLAGSVTDGDEALKSGVGVACVSGVVTAYRTWRAAK